MEILHSFWLVDPKVVVGWYSKPSAHWSNDDLTDLTAFCASALGTKVEKRIDRASLLPCEPWRRRLQHSTPEEDEHLQLIGPPANQGWGSTPEGSNGCQSLWYVYPIAYPPMTQFTALSQILPCCFTLLCLTLPCNVKFYPRFPQFTLLFYPPMSKFTLLCPILPSYIAFYPCLYHFTNDFTLLWRNLPC